MAVWTKPEILDAIRTSEAGKERWLTAKAMRRGEGVLRMRVRGGACSFWMRYTNDQGRQVQKSLERRFLPDIAALTLVIDTKDPDAGSKKALRDEAWAELDKVCDAAAADAKALNDTLKEHRNLHQHLAQEEQRAEEARAAAERREKEASSKTLEALCRAYVADLAKRGKWSAKEAESLLAKNVIGAFPELAERPAKDIGPHDIHAVLSKVMERVAAERGISGGRTAGKVRSYLAAAFTAGLQAEFDATAHAALKGFNLTANPVLAIKSVEAYKAGAGERTLSESELRALLAELKEQDTLPARAILLALYCGGQRVAQTLRLSTDDVDLNESVIVLYDGKGRRSKPRAHVLPLTGPARAIIEPLYRQAQAKGLPIGKKAYLFARDQVPLRGEELSETVRDIAKAMVEDGRAETPFQLRDVRRTVETALARMGVHKDVRAQLLSHGISGVQDKHYDKYDYLAEKRAVLQAWADKLADIERDEPALPSNVIPLHGRAG